MAKKNEVDVDLNEELKTLRHDKWRSQLVWMASIIIVVLVIAFFLASTVGLQEQVLTSYQEKTLKLGLVFMIVLLVGYLLDREERLRKINVTLIKNLQKTSEMLRYRMNQLAVLNRISLILSSSLNMTESFTYMMKDLCQKLPLEGGILYLVSGDKIEAKSIYNLNELYNINQFPPCQRVTQVVGMGKGDPLTLTDIKTTEKMSQDDLFYKEEFDSAIIVPLMSNNILKGVFLAFSRKPEKSLGPEEADFLKIIGLQLTLSISNSELYSKVSTEKLMEERKLSAVIENMGDGVVALDRSFNILLVNSVAKNILTRSAPESSGSDLATILNQQIYLDLWREALLNHEGPAVREFDVEGPSHLTLIVLATPLKDVLGRIEGVIMVLRDVTHEREVMKLKDDFISTISHELRTPLTSIKAYTDMLMEGAISKEDSVNYLKVVKEETDRLSLLLDDLLDLSLLRSGKYDLERSLQAINPTIDMAINAISQPAVKKNLKLLYEAKDLPPVTISSNHIYRALVNLLQNAVKYTPEGGSITVNSGTDPNYLWITVSDTGIGIGPEEQLKIFDKFYQVESSSTRSHGGAGIGLSLVKQLIELHGGTIEVASEVGKGSTFTIKLPLR